MDERLGESGYIRMDETPVQVLKSEKAATAEHYMWIRVAGPARQRIILFDYDASRSAEVAARLSARANELEPYTYLRRLFAELPAARSVADLEALLPWKTLCDY